MKNRIKLCLQVAWLTAAFVVLVMGFNFCAATDQACSDAGGRMLVMLFLLSFPAGFFSIVAAVILLSPIDSIDYLESYAILWLILSCAGYIQWFVLVPRLFAKPTFTTLGLGQSNMVTGKPNEIAPKDAKETTTEFAPRPTPGRKRVRTIPPYDKRGRTPLERALGSTSTNASA